MRYKNIGSDFVHLTINITLLTSYTIYSDYRLPIYVKGLLEHLITHMQVLTFRHQNQIHRMSVLRNEFWKMFIDNVWK